MKSIKLESLNNQFDNVDISYDDILSYEIARENICGYMFFLDRKKDKSNHESIAEIDKKIEDLIYLRDHLQIEDKHNVSLVLGELIPEYKAEQEKCH
jgi:hypothetical protein